MKTEISFGEDFDAQRDRIRKAMQNKNVQQNIEWMEDYEKRQAKKQEEKQSYEKVGVHNRVSGSSVKS